MTAYADLVPPVTALRPITQAQFERLGEKAREVIALDRAYDAAMAGWLDGVRLGDNVLSLDAARATLRPQQKAWRAHLTRALAIVCNRGADPIGGGPRTASMGRR